MGTKTGTIYIITNLINGKQYVGQTIKRLQIRINKHKNSNECRAIHRAIKKYGFENFNYIHFDYPIKKLNQAEIFLIKELRTLAPNGYNLNTGGVKRKKLSKETIRKMRKPKTEAHKQKMRKPRPSMQGENHPSTRNARKIVFISPEKIEYKVGCVRAFCKEYTLDRGTMYKVLDGIYKQHRGWMAKYAND